MKPDTDPCSTCQGFTVSLSKTENHPMQRTQKKHKIYCIIVSGFMSIISGHCSNHNCLNSDKLMFN
jgi:hypothetical protein